MKKRNIFSFFSFFLKTEYDKLIPGHKIKTALTEAERLSVSLRERYATPEGKRQKLDDGQLQGEGVRDQQVPNDTADGNDKPKSAEEVYRLSNVSEKECGIAKLNFRSLCIYMMCNSKGGHNIRAIDHAPR